MNSTSAKSRASNGYARAVLQGMTRLISSVSVGMSLLLLTNYMSALFLLLSLAPASSFAQSDPRCSNNGGPYQCLKSNLKFVRYDGEVFLSPDELCQSYGDLRFHFNIRFEAQVAGCFAQITRDGITYSGTYQNWALPTQSCQAWSIYPAVSTERLVGSWRDGSDVSEVYYGRDWCIYEIPSPPP